MILVVGGALYGIYENYTYKRCVDKFKLRPFTYDIKKFIDCGMISYSDAKGLSQNQVREIPLLEMLLEPFVFGFLNYF